jgi:uncharacterized membrane protein (UPF0127 family)
MLNNQRRREILDTARATGFQGSILDLYKMANSGINVEAMLENQPLVAQTPQQQQVGLREQQAMGNTNASMVFPDVPANTSFNTQGMKAPINITKVDDQGHLVKSYQNVPPGIQDLPTGPKRGTVIETPAYQGGGFKGMPLNLTDVLQVATAEKMPENKKTAMDKVEDIYSLGAANSGRPLITTVDYLKGVIEKPSYYKGMVKAARDAAKGDEFAKKVLRRFYGREKQKVNDLIREGKRFGQDVYKVLKPLAKTARAGFTTVLPVDVSKDASDMPALYGTGAQGDPYATKIDYNKVYQRGGIYIKPENRGKFTAWAKKRNLTVKQAANKVMSNKEEYPTSVVKMANFAKNFAKQMGGVRSEYRSLSDI